MARSSAPSLPCRAWFTPPLPGPSQLVASPDDWREAGQQRELGQPERSGVKNALQHRQIDQRGGEDEHPLGGALVDAGDAVLKLDLTRETVRELLDAL